MIGLTRIESSTNWTRLAGCEERKSLAVIVSKKQNVMVSNNDSVISRYLYKHKYEVEYV